MRTGMSASASLAFLLQECRLDGRVGKKSEVVVLLVDLVVEILLVEVQAESDGTHDEYVEFVARLQ